MSSESGVPVPTRAEPVRVVLDTSVLVAAMRSRRGASFALVTSIPSARFKICLSVALYLEWQDVLTRPSNLPAGISPDAMLGFLRHLCDEAERTPVFFLWRPFLPDLNDDMIVELAFAANCPYIVTHNIRHFAGSRQLGIQAIRPGDFLRLISSARTGPS